MPQELSYFQHLFVIFWAVFGKRAAIHTHIVSVTAWAICVTLKPSTQPLYFVSCFCVQVHPVLATPSPSAQAFN
jgi:hypothetical protein